MLLILKKYWSGILQPSELIQSILFFQIPFKIMRGHEHIVTSCNFCVDDAKVLSGSYDCTVKLWVGARVRWSQNIP